MISMKPPHKFFDVVMDNDLEELSLFLIQKQEEILNNKIPGFNEEDLSKFDKMNGVTTQLGHCYNIFDKEYFGHDALRDLHRELRNVMHQACDYYGINYDDQKYIIHAWYNLDYKTQNIENGVSPLKNSNHFHDHMAGEGAPFFHGYYCVNAEPSSTFYKIGGIDGELFENVNKNNRAIISETGHPHGRDDWFEDKPRITIAYDIKPSAGLDIPLNWMIL
jgi:hypothetical protein